MKFDDLKLFKNNNELKETIGEEQFNKVSNVIKEQKIHHKQLLKRFQDKLSKPTCSEKAKQELKEK